MRMIILCFSMFIGLVLIVASQLKCVLLCSREKWEFVFDITTASYYILQPEGTESANKYTTCMFLQNEEVYIIQRLLQCLYEMLKCDQINFLTEKIQLRYFILLLIQDHKFCVNKVAAQKREWIENATHPLLLLENLTGNSHNFFIFMCNTQREIVSSLSSQIVGLSILWLSVGDLYMIIEIISNICEY